MKILITHYSICDYGGLVNDTEIMTAGFKSLGHEVCNIMLTPKSYGLKKGKGLTMTPRSSGYERGMGTGLWIHHKSGWLGMDTYGFLDVSKIKEWRKFTKEFDLIIYQNPVPTCRKEYKGSDAWISLYKNKIPQIAISPDANFRRAYPHLYKVVGYLKGVACTHEAGYKACELLPTKRILLPGPHVIDMKDVRKRIKSKRTRGLCSVQNFKPIKHVDDLIRSIPYMKRKTKKIVAGGGIEYHYMTSKNKVKEKYLDDNGERIWNNAEKNNMKFVGYISNEERDKIMTEVDLLVDCSWSEKYSLLGPHFNRTFIEAMKNGCVPVCTDLGMDGSEIFKADKNYVRIPAKCSAEERAILIEKILSDKVTIESIRKNNVKMLKYFDHLYICQQLINLGMEDSPEGLLGDPEVGVKDRDITKASNKIMEFFN